MDKYTSTFGFRKTGPWQEPFGDDRVGGRYSFYEKYNIAVSRVGENEWQVSFNDEVLEPIEQVNREFLEEMVARKYALSTT